MNIQGTRKAPAHILFFLIWMFGFLTSAQAEVAIPALKTRVTDLTRTLEPFQIQALENKLQEFEKIKGSQLAIVILATTAPETIEQFAIRLADNWKLGREKVDDGALLIIAKNDRALRIEVGYGLEGAITDATSKRIIAEVITPYFKKNDFYGGITSGIDQIIAVIQGEPLPPPEISSETSNSSNSYLPILFLIALICGAVLRTIFGRFFGSLFTGGILTVVAWILAGSVFIALLAGFIGLLFTLFGGMRGGFLGGGMGSGGFGRGGFGGGGGGFGGGGASGNW
ncbi:MAG: YgcG family protein [Pseudomonadota bacterium]